jgi:pimeloyl-ACP methyl ester carboxylesterase
VSRSSIALIVLLLLIAAAIPLFFARTPPISGPDGSELAGSIASLERVRIGGVDQWILVRGHDRNNPVLLWLHGGPGAAQMPVARHYNGALERDFVVVHWDQRGAGKSNGLRFDASTMSFRRFVADVRELTEYLKGRFGQERIYLLGHSWGSQLGIVVARTHPEHFHAYIGMAQVVGGAHSQPIAYDWLRRRLAQDGRDEDRAALEALGEPPYRVHADYVAFAGLVDRYGGNMDVSFPKLLAVSLLAREYTPLDHVNWLRGARRGSGSMWNDPAYADFDAFEDVPMLSIPAYFLSGIDDYNTPALLTQQYCRALVALEGKQLIVFHRSAHTPFLAEPEAFHDALRVIRHQVESGAVPLDGCTGAMSAMH